MKIRDGYATINGDETEYDLPSDSLEIIADDGRCLFEIRKRNDGSIDISTGMTCRHGGKILETGMLIKPSSYSLFKITRPEYKP